MTTDTASNNDIIASYVAGASSRAIPPEVLDAARLCLVDWTGVVAGAAREDAGRIVHTVMKTWKMSGRSTMLLGGQTGAAAAALANGTMAHCLDFDDTYVKANTHTSAPVWAATLALGEEIDATEREMLVAFVTGFEVAARVGYDLGEAVTARGLHATGVFGRIGAAAACAVLLKLDRNATQYALGLAATQVSGLVGSFGTMSKPFHAGKAAFDGVLSAQIASAGFVSATGLLEPAGGLSTAIIQDKAVRIKPANFDGWEILNNSFKPYAACHLTHPAVDAARAIGLSNGELARVQQIDAEVGALAEQVTGRKPGAPVTALEAKFDMKYCVALALYGASLSAADFGEPFRPDAAVLATAAKVRVRSSDAKGYASAGLAVTLENGEVRRKDIAVAKGHPGNPVNWDDMQAKFNGLTQAVAGERTAEIFESLQNFGTSSSRRDSALKVLASLISGHRQAA